MAIASALSFSFSRVCNECRETQKRKSQTLVTRQQYIFIYIKLFEILNRSVDVLERACQHFFRNCLIPPCLLNEIKLMKLGRVYIVNTLPYFPGQNKVRVNVLGAKVYKKKEC